MKLKKNNRSRKWYAVYTDERGRLRERSTGTTIRKLAEEIGAKWDADARRVREGLLDPAQLRVRDAAREPVTKHLEDYLEWSLANGQSAPNVRTKGTQIRAFLEEQSCSTLRHVTPALLGRFMQGVVRRGCAPRTANLHRQNVIAFMNWCKDCRRIESHDLTKRTVPKLKEAEDCRRRRRALTGAELARLKAASLSSGRWWKYQLAFSTGLRRGELGKLRWADVDLEAGVVRVRASISKNSRDAELPIMPEARESLEALRRLHAGSELVVPRVPCKETFYRDLERAGIQGVTERGGCAANAAGERVDFHALRTTCATRLAELGVSPWVAKDFMRHATLAMTEKHYVKLRTTDLRSNIERALEKPVALARTGTEGLPPKLPPATATNGDIQGATGYRLRASAGTSGGGASGWRRVNYVHRGTSASDAVQHPGNTGPVAQRPRAVDS
jgi:integrase